MIRSASEFVGGIENPLWQVAERLEDEPSEDTVVSLAAAVSGKAPNALTDEDFGRATGVMEVASALAKGQAEQRSSGNYVVVLPNGQRRTIAAPPDYQRDGSIIEDGIVQWRSRFSLTAEEAAFFALEALLPEEVDVAKEDEVATSGDQGDESEE